MTEKKRVCDFVSIITKHGQEVYQFDAYIHGKRVQKQIGVVGKVSKAHIKAYSLRLYNELLNEPLKQTTHEIKDMKLGEAVELFFDVLEKEPYKIVRKRKRTSPTYIDDHYHSSRSLVAHFGKKLISTITDDEIQGYLHKRHSIRTVSTVNKEIVFLRLFWRFMITQGIVKDDIVSTIRIETPHNNRNIVFSEEEFNLMLTNCTGDQTHLKPILFIAGMTGMRRGELLSLKWKQIDIDKKAIHLFQTKSRVPQDVMLCEDVIDALIEMRKMVQDNEAHVFLYKGKPIKDVKTAFHKLLKKCGLDGKGYHFHDTRSYYASKLAREGVSPFVIQRLCRHQDIKTTLRYVRGMESQMLDGVKALNHSLQWNQ